MSPVAIVTRRGVLLRHTLTYAMTTKCKHVDETRALFVSNSGALPELVPSPPNAVADYNILSNHVAERIYQMIDETDHF